MPVVLAYLFDWRLEDYVLDVSLVHGFVLVTLLQGFKLVMLNEGCFELTGQYFIDRSFSFRYVVTATVLHHYNTTEMIY